MLVNFILNISDAIANRIAFFDSLLLVNRKAADFYVLIFITCSFNESFISTNLCVCVCVCV